MLTKNEKIKIAKDMIEKDAEDNEKSASES